MSDTTDRVSLNNTNLDLKIRNFKILSYFIDCRILQPQNHVSTFTLIFHSDGINPA
jgi:hypothetical protein